MKIVVIADHVQKAELLEQGVLEDATLEWQAGVGPVPGADAYIDLLFDNTAERIDRLENLQPATVIVNAIDNTLAELPASFTRINGWNSFLKRPLVESAGPAANKAIIENIFSCFNKKTEWVADVPGFITARVIAMIINEAWFTLDENVSTKEEIDTAMKLGTNYPYGPFEWGEKIGLKNIVSLLTILAKTNSRYQPSPLLLKEAFT